MMAKYNQPSIFDKEIYADPKKIYHALKKFHQFPYNKEKNITSKDSDKAFDSAQIE
jgi:hypothetical protein